MKRRQSRQAKKGRIEIIPMIDVMFFLLATFMLASLSLQNLHSLPVNLPSGKAGALQTHDTITLTVTADSRLLLNDIPVTLQTLSTNLKPLFKQLNEKQPDSPSNHKIVLSADSAAPHGLTVQAMLKAREAGATQFLIAIKHE